MAKPIRLMSFAAFVVSVCITPPNPSPDFHSAAIFLAGVFLTLAVQPKF